MRDADRPTCSRMRDDIRANYRLAMRSATFRGSSIRATIAPSDVGTASIDPVSGSESCLQAARERSPKRDLSLLVIATPSLIRSDAEEAPRYWARRAVNRSRAPLALPRRLVPPRLTGEGALMYSLGNQTVGRYLERRGVRSSEVLGSGRLVAGGGKTVSGRFVALLEMEDLLDVMDDGDDDLVAYLAAPNVTMIAPVQDRLVAILCATGDELAHVAIVSRELQIPCAVQSKLSQPIEQLRGLNVALQGSGELVAAEAS